MPADLSVVAITAASGLILMVMVAAFLVIRRGEARAQAQLDDLGQRAETLSIDLRQREDRVHELERLNGELSVRADQSEAFEHQVRHLQEREATLRATIARLEAEQTASDTAHAEKVAALEAVNTQIKQELKQISSQALEENRHKGQAEFQQMMKPFAEHIQKYDERLKEVEKARVAAESSLKSEIGNLFKAHDQVRNQTTQLITALKAGPKTAGRWGEEQLRNVLELAGMAEHCDFETEKSFKRDNANLRPDVILHLPGKRQLVVDAKTNIAAYMDALETDDEQQKELLLAQHARQLRQHMKELGGKAYWDGLTFTPDFVVMFVPGDNFYAAALQQDHTLFDDAIANKVIIATPTTLIALAKAVAFGWRQDKIAEKAQEAAELGADLYAALRALGGHVVNVGKGVEKSVEHYNKMVSSLERTVFSKARRFPDLGIVNDHKDIPDLKEIENHTSQPKGRDLILPDEPMMIAEADSTPKDLLS